MRGQRVNVLLFDPISILFQLSSSKKSLIIYQGNILDSKLSFQDCGITEGDKIIINQSEDNFKADLFWINFSKSESYMKQFPSIQDNPAYKREFLRLNDLKLMRNERIKSSYSKLIQQLSFFQDDSPENVFKTNINFEKNEPSISPLPNIFSNE
jgi:hypothetical protein